jgi:hypothetical protein
MRFLGEVTFCPEKGGRCKIVEGRCSNCNAEVKPWRSKEDRRRERSSQLDSPA